MESEINKVRVVIEYDMRSISSAMLWNYISTENGLEQWFADDVRFNHKECEFLWNGVAQGAHIIAMRSGVYIKFRWDEEPKDTFFEMRISKNELTGATMLSVTDFGEDEEDVHDLWNAQVEVLKRILGC